MPNELYWKTVNHLSTKKQKESFKQKVCQNGLSKSWGTNNLIKKNQANKTTSKYGITHTNSWVRKPRAIIQKIYWFLCLQPPSRMKLHPIKQSNQETILCWKRSQEWISLMNNIPHEQMRTTKLHCVRVDINQKNIRNSNQYNTWVQMLPKKLHFKNKLFIDLSFLQPQKHKETKWTP